MSPAAAAGHRRVFRDMDHRSSSSSFFTSSPLLAPWSETVIRDGSSERLASDGVRLWRPASEHRRQRNPHRCRSGRSLRSSLLRSWWPMTPTPARDGAWYDRQTTQLTLVSVTMRESRRYQHQHGGDQRQRRALVSGPPRHSWSLGIRTGLRTSSFVTSTQGPPPGRASPTQAARRRDRKRPSDSEPSGGRFVAFASSVAPRPGRHIRRQTSSSAICPRTGTIGSAGSRGRNRRLRIEYPSP